MLGKSNCDSSGFRYSSIISNISEKSVIKLCPFLSIFSVGVYHTHCNKKQNTYKILFNKDGGCNLVNQRLNQII